MTVTDHASLLAFISSKLKIKRYLEIGVRRTADCFDGVSADVKIGVDPDPHSGATHAMTSDEFFATYSGPQFDLVFIDGDHHHAQAWRDCINSLDQLAPDGQIVIHDSRPAHAGLEDPSFCGTTWRAVAKLSELPNVDSRCIAFDHGVAVVKKQPNPSPTQINKSLDDLCYADLEAHGHEWLRLCSLERGIAFALDRQTVEKNTLCLCVVGKSNEENAGFISVHANEIRRHADELILINNEKGRFGGLGQIANRALDTTRSSVFGISHADCGYRNGALGVFRDQAAKGKVAGIVGRPLDGRYIWACAGGSERSGAQISCLDGCGIFFRRDSGLRFDAETFDGFHCVGEDLSLAARARGIPVIVADAEADHRSSSNFPDPGQRNADRLAWLADYHRYVQKLKAKWPNLEFITS
jgi:hypothetical protein